MNLLTIPTRIRAAATAAYSSFSTAYNSANDSAGVRSSTVGMPMDSRRELTYRTRLELVKKSRWLSNNLGVYRRFIQGTSRYAVGKGIVHIPNTKDTEWNKLADDYFDEWASNETVCDVRCAIPFWKMQKIICRGMLRDGDGFALKVGNGEEQLASGRKIIGMPQLQLVDGLTVASPFYMASDGYDQDGFRDGIRSTSFGRPIEYSILLDSDPLRLDLAKQKKVPADAVRHIFDYERATSNRGIPWCSHGENSAIDTLDLVALEKAAVKLHSMLAATVKKKSGDTGKGGGFSGGLVRTGGTKADGAPKVTAYENFAGGAGILHLSLDEEFQLAHSERPNSTFEGFIDFLIRDMAWGLGVSPEFIWCVAGLAGPSARLVINDANWFFEEVQDILVYALCRPIYTWVIARGLERGDLPACKDPMWWACNWQGPAKISIDEGRLGQLELAQLDAGVGTSEGFWSQRGESGSKMMKKRVEEIRDAMEYCKKLGVPYEFFRTMKPGTPLGTGPDPSSPEDPNNPTQ